MTGRNATWRRHTLEASFWMGIIALFWTLDTLTKVEVRERTGVGLNDFRLITEQATSGVSAFLMVAFVVFWLRQFPLDRTRPLPTLVGHVAGSMLFALGHYTVFVVLRTLVFRFNGLEYMRGQKHLGNLIFEYQKDIKIYLAMVAIIAVYGRFRGQRAAGIDKAIASETTEPVQESVGPATSESPPPRKLAVQTRSGERFLEIDQIDYLEAARNYVSVHTDERKYLVRTPLGTLLERLPPGRFIRTHRSFLVNMDAITEVRAGGPGQRLLLRSGAKIPVSRSYRDEVKRRLESVGV